MAEYVPDWASGSASNVPQAQEDQTPSWATASGGVPAWAQQSSNDAFIKQMTQNIHAPIAHEATGSAQGGTDVLSRAVGAAKGGVREAIFGNPIYRHLAENDPGAIADAMKANPNLTLEQAQDQVRQNVRQYMAQQAGQGQAEVEANSQGNHPILNSIIPGIAGSAFDPAAYIAPELKITGPLAKAAEPVLGKLASKVAGRVGESLAHGAVVGGAMGGENAINQAINIHDKLQDKFDVDQSLQAAAGGAIFGAGLHMAASPFVKGLFEDRGVDTTPEETPTAKTTPLSGEPMPTDTGVQYQELLQKGSSQDIKDFFNGRNGPKPNPDQIDRWVNYRDGVPEGFAQEEFQPQFDYEAETNKQAVRDHIQQQTANWKNAPQFEVVHDVNEIQDPGVRQYAINQGANDPNTLGFVGPDGQVRIFANRIDSTDTLNALIYHEALGHYGLQQKFGDTLDRVLQTLMDRNVGKFNDRVDEWQKNNPTLYNGDRVRAAEEVLAEDSQNGQIKPSWADALSAQVRRFGRRMGLDLGYSDNEINTILGMAHDAVVNGNGRDVRANGFRVSTPQSTKYTPLNLDTTFGENGSNKFMNRSQLAASRDYTIKSLQETYNALDKDYEPETRNWEETRRAALQSGFKPSQVKDLADVGELDKKMYRMGAAAKMLDTKIDELNKRLDTPQWSMQDKADYIQAVSDYNYMLQRIRDNRAEVARALNISKAIGFTRAQMEDINKMLQEQGGDLSPLADDETFLKFARQVKQMKANGNPAGANALIQGITKPYWWQYLLSFRQNMMLSALSTHLKSTMDMATNAGRDIEEHVMALPGGLIRNIINGLGGNVKSGVQPTEVAAHLWGLARAAAEAKTYADSIDALKNGFNQNQANGNFGPRMPDIPIANIPSHMVAAQDTFFRSFLHNANLYQLGARKAYQELKAQNNKVKWDDVMSLGASYARAPSKEMLDEAHEMANQTILMNRSPVNSLIGQAKAIRPGMNALQQTGSFLANLLTTFTRIQSNAFMNQVIRRSPLFLLDGRSRADLAAGGARADVAITRAILGTTLMGMYWNAADPKKHKIEGEGPNSSSKRLAMEASGYRPNSIHENGQYRTGNTLNLSLNPLDMHNNTAIMIAGIRQAYEEGFEKKDVATGLKLAAYSIIHNFASSTFVNDLVPAMDAFTSRAPNMGQKVQKFLADEARTFLPNVTTQAAKIIDPNQHDTGGTVVGAIEQNTPGLTGNLPIKYSVYGEPLKTGTTISGLHNWVSSGNHTEESADPTIKELSRLENSVKSTLVSPVQKTIRVMDTPIKLTPDQFEDYQKYAGQTIVEAVRDEMSSGSWSKMSDQDRIDYVRNIEKEAKSQVRDALLQKEGWLKEDQLSNLRKQLNGQ